MTENAEFLKSQLITYIGNKRALIGDIEDCVKKIAARFGRRRLACCDMFSGSGVVARMLKRYAETLVVNDLEDYSYLVNSCYLSNKNEIDWKRYDTFLEKINNSFKDEIREGIITRLYAPRDEFAITERDRVFYTRENALKIDTYRALIDEKVSDATYKKFFLAPLVVEASIHVNTSGVFKGFYKDKRTGLGAYGGAGRNALLRIRGDIELKKPVLSNFNSKLALYKENALTLAPKLPPLDIAYLDPPYNQHPYGSNYFMLNLIINNKIDSAISKVSGIPCAWNRSEFNKRDSALPSLEKIISSLDAKFIILSYNSEGFVPRNALIAMLKKYGKIEEREIRYNAFRGSRNLRSRPIHVSEYLFTLEKT